MTTEELLDKYFDGKTSCEEEKQLRRFFTEGNVPPHLQIYIPMFAYLEHESRQYPQHPVRMHRRGKLKQIAYWTVGVAAGISLLFGIYQLTERQHEAENYVIINGQRYTDTKLAKAKALEALQNVSFTEEELNELLFQH